MIRSLAGRNGLLVGLLVLLLAVATVSAGQGAVQVPVDVVLSVFLEQLGLPALTEVTPGHRLVVWNLRVPRIAFGVLVGAGLSVGGAVMQGLFRNPLASPGLVGVSTGAALAAAVFIVLGTGLPASIAVWGLPLSAFLGALLTCAVVFAVATRAGHTSVTTLLLAGVALNALSAAGIGLLVFVADDAAIRNITFWNLGSLGAATWANTSVLALLTVPPVLACLFLSGPLNALLLGEAEAGHLGVNVERLKQGAVGLVALMVGASVSLTGTIGFVGLVVPHLCRLLLGPDHHGVVPASLVLGPLLLLSADLLARTVVAPAELPIGILTTFLGVPFFLWLLIRTRGGFGVDGL